MDQQLFEAHVEEAAQVADSYPRDGEQASAALWLEHVQATTVRPFLQRDVWNCDDHLYPCGRCVRCRAHFEEF